MATYVSIVNWSGCPQPARADVASAVAGARPFFRARGLNSLAIMPDEGECSAIMVSRCDDEAAAAGLAALILPATDVSVESMRFDDEPELPAWIARDEQPPRLPSTSARTLPRHGIRSSAPNCSARGDYRDALLAAVRSN